MTGTSPLHEAIRANPGCAVLVMRQPASTELMNRFGYQALDAWKETVVRLLDAALPGALVFRQAEDLTVVLSADGTDLATWPARLAGLLPVLSTVLAPLPVPVHSVLGLAPAGDPPDPDPALRAARGLSQLPAPLQAADAVRLTATCHEPCGQTDPRSAQVATAVGDTIPGSGPLTSGLSTHVPGRGQTLTPAGLAALSNYLTAASVVVAAAPALLTPTQVEPD